MNRQHYIDTLRAVNIFLLTLYHSGLVFSPQGWFIENAEKSALLGDLTHSALVLVPMPLLMFLAGATTFYSFQKRSSRQYIQERFTHILLPLVLGIAIVIPPHVYTERLFRGRFSGSFIEFYPKFYTEGIVPAGNFTYRHLWFLAYLLVLSLVALPIFGAINRNREAIARFLRHPLAILLPALPMIAIEIALRADWYTTLNIFADWANILLYFQVLVWGYMLTSHADIQAAVRRAAPAALLIGMGLMLISEIIFTEDQLLGFIPRDDPQYVWACILRSLIIWCGLVGIMGMGSRWNTNPHPSSPVYGGGVRRGLIRYAKTISYPYYIFHQTVIVLLAYYFIIDLNASVLAKFVILVISTAIITLLLCEITRRLPAIGQVFGMRR